MKSSMVYSLSAYATSSFQGHSLLPVITVVAGAMAGAVYIPMAKALDLWGRAEGFLVMVLFCIIGLVLLTASENITTYCAGEVSFCWIENCHQLAFADMLSQGLLPSRLRRPGIQLGRACRRRDQPEKSRSCIRLYLVASVDLSLRRLRSSARVP